MKLKKLMALLLAGTMALSTLPMAAMAWSEEDEARPERIEESEKVEDEKSEYPDDLANDEDDFYPSDNDEDDFYPSDNDEEEEGGEEEESSPVRVTYANGDSIGTETEQELISTVDNPISNVSAFGEQYVLENGPSVIVDGPIVSNDTDAPAIEAIWGANVKTVNGGVDTRGSSYSIYSVYAVGGSSVNIDGDVLIGENNTVAIGFEYEADVKVKGNVIGTGINGLAIEACGGSLEIGGDVKDFIQIFDASNSDIDIAGEVSSTLYGINSHDSNIHLAKGLTVGLADKADEFELHDCPAIRMDSESTVIVDGSVNVKNVPTYASEVAVITGSDFKVGGDFNTDIARALLLNDTDDETLVEIVGNINGYIDADANSDITVIVGGVLDGKLVLNGDLRSKEEIREEERRLQEEAEDDKKGREDWGEPGQSNEVRTVADLVDLPDGATFVLWKAVDEDGNIATEEDLFELDLDMYTKKTTVEIPESEYEQPEPGNDDKEDLEADTTDSLAEQLEKAYHERTYYIIREADPKNVTMNIYGDYVRDFTGVEDANKGTNDYQAVRQGQYFEVAVEAPKGCKVTLTAGENDGIEVIPMKDGTFQVWVNAAGGGINLAATFEKIMKSFKVEKATSSSSAPSFRVTDQQAQLAADKAKLTAKVKCGNMDYARKLLANVRFYLDEELSENKYYTVYLNDNGELEVELSPELIAMIEAGYHLVEMVLDNGTNVPFDINLIKD